MGAGMLTISKTHLLNQHSWVCKSKLIHNVEVDSIPIVHVKNILVMEKVFQPHVALTAPNFMQRNQFVRECV